jgi:hypothetical protein
MLVYKVFNLSQARRFFQFPKRQATLTCKAFAKDDPFGAPSI